MMFTMIQTISDVKEWFATTIINVPVDIAMMIWFALGMACLSGQLFL